jgi:hypothetical protein
MTNTQTTERTPPKPLRLWPGVVLAVLLALFWFVVPPVLPDLTLVAIAGAFAAVGAVVIWWLFFSRAPWAERVGAILLAIVALAATRSVVDESIASGMMGMLLPVYAIPVLSLALVAGAVLGRRLFAGLRRAVMASGILAASGVFALIRTAGITGFHSEYHWRWTPTPEDRLLAETAGEPVALPAPPAPGAEASKEPTAIQEGRAFGSGGRGGTEPPPVTIAAREAAEWPGFRGPNRDGIVRGIAISTDWTASPPVELWRRPIGPGWSSFAVRGDYFYTQEQRGSEEIVACYRVSTGKPVWRHRDPVRFWESNGGPGPRALPVSRALRRVSPEPSA